MTDTPDTLQRLGPYRVLRELGSGAMGTVYLADDEEEGRRIALKVLHPHLFKRRGFFKRFQREAWAGEKVRHPNVVRTFDCGLQMDGETPYCVLAMEYVEGQTLRALLDSLGVVPEVMLREIALQIAAGLTAIHEAGIVHRDLKPENVLITSDHEIRIMDLGVARFTQASTVLTQEGQFAGSLVYAAPEQFRTAEVGPGADLYALGVTLYELAAGVNPFQGDEAAAVMRAHLEDVPQRLDLRAEGISPFLGTIVETLLQKDPAQRFAASTDLVEVLSGAEGSDWWAECERKQRRRKAVRPRVPVRRDTKLYGRDADLNALHRAWQSAMSGCGNTVLLQGEAGIGKSRILDAFLEAAELENAHVLYGSYAPAGGVGGLAAGLVAQLGPRDLGEVLSTYLHETPALARILAGVLGHGGRPPSTPSDEAAIQTALCYLVHAMALEKPVLWLIEDLHFAQPEWLHRILALARSVEGRSVLLVLTTRPELDPRVAQQLGQITNVQCRDVMRLGARDVVLLLRDALRNERLVEKLAPKVAVQSDGVPFFVYEMIRGLKQRQILTRLPDGSWIDTQEVDRIPVPDEIRSLIALRLHDLDTASRSILDVGAVIGFEFDPSLAASVLERPLVDVLQQLTHLERSRGIVRSEGRAFRFDHHQFQEILASDLPQSLREAYCDRLVQVLGAQHRKMEGEWAALVCEYAVQSASSECALDTLLPTLDHLQATCQGGRAVALARSALRRGGWVCGERRLEVLHRLDALLELLGLRHEQEPVLEEIRSFAESSGDPSTMSRAEHAVGIWHERLDRLEEARHCFEKALGLAERAGDKKLQCRMMLSLAQPAQGEGDSREAERLTRTTLSLARELGDREVESTSLGNLGVSVSWLGRVEEALDLHRQHLGLARELKDKRGVARALGNIGHCCAALGRKEDAQDHYEQSLDMARALGDREGDARVSSQLAALSLNEGRVDEALGLVRRVSALYRELGSSRGEGIAEHQLGAVCRTLGQVTRGKAHQERSLELARRTGDRVQEAHALFHLAADAEDRDDLRKAERLHLEGQAILQECGVAEARQLSLSTLGQLVAQLGRLAEARVFFDEAQVLAERCHDLDTLVLVHASRAAFLAVDPASAQSMLDRHGDALAQDTACEAHFLLWGATSDRLHLEGAKHCLDRLVQNAPEQYRESMLKNVRLNREIMAAWAEHGGGEPEEAPETC